MALSLKDHPHRILLLFVSLCVVLLGILIFAVPPGTDPDPCWGFMIMNSMEHGGHFNLLVSPAQNNIANNRYEFLSWWSPGQYMLPYFFKSLLKVTTGQAVSLTIAICGLVGLMGYYKLFTQLGFTKWIAAISIAFIASQLLFISPFTYYLGGESPIFAFMGWFLYGCFSFKKITWQLLVFIFLGGLIGFFAKSSFLWMYAAGLACVWINLSLYETPHPYAKKGVLKWLKNGSLLAIPFICAIAVIYIFYLSKGDNPTSDQGSYLIRPETFGYPLASPLLSAFSVDEYLGGLLDLSSGASMPHHKAVIVVLIAAFFSLAYLFLTTKLSPGTKYRLAFCVFYGTGVVFFTYMYLKQATISYEGRHFRIIGLLFIPGFVYMLFKTKVTRALFFVAWIFFIYTAFNFFKEGYKANREDARGNTGLAQQVYDKAALSEIVKLDKYNRGAIFVLTSSDIGAEINNNRVITFDNDTPIQSIADLKYHGTAGPLYILMPASYLTNGREKAILSTFLNYNSFTCKQLSPGYYLYYARN